MLPRRAVGSGTCQCGSTSRAHLREHGVFLRYEAEALGYHDHAIARAVASRVGGFAYDAAPTSSREIYVEPWTLPERYDLLCRAAVRQARPPVVLSHTSSLAQWGCPLWEAASDRGPPDATGRDGPRDARPDPASIAAYWSTGDVVERNGLLVTSPARAALEYTTMADVEHSLVEIDDLLHRKLVELADLRPLRRDGPVAGHPHHRPGAAPGRRPQRVRGRDPGPLPGWSRACRHLRSTTRSSTRTAVRWRGSTWRGRQYGCSSSSTAR